MISHFFTAPCCTVNCTFPVQCHQESNCGEAALRLDTSCLDFDHIKYLESANCKHAKKTRCP